MSAQFSETIHYKGHQTAMFSNPLSDYFLMTGIGDSADSDFGCTAFGFWRTVEEANKHAEWLLTQGYNIEI